MTLKFEPGRASFGADIRWQDVLQPSSGINPLGAAGAATVDPATGLLVFSGTADSVVAGVIQLPHGRYRGAVVPHLHLRFPTSAAANTRWRFEYDVANVGADWANATGTYTAAPVITAANPENVNRHVLAAFAALDLAAYGDSACLLWKLTRLAASDAADNHTADVLLVSFDTHIQISATGSRAQGGD